MFGITVKILEFMRNYSSTFYCKHFSWGKRGVAANPSIELQVRVGWGGVSCADAQFIKGPHINNCSCSILRTM